MTIAAVVLAIVLALFSAFAGVPKVMLKGPAPEMLTGRGLSTNLVRFIGAAEIAGAVGLLIGIAWHPLGVAAGIGLAIVFAGAVIFHVRHGDFSNAETRGGSVPSIVAFVLAVVTIIIVAAA